MGHNPAALIQSSDNSSGDMELPELNSALTTGIDTCSPRRPAKNPRAVAAGRGEDSDHEIAIASVKGEPVPSAHPTPSYSESEFVSIVRRQRVRADNALKIPHHHLTKVRSRDAPPASSGTNFLHEFEFSGWGSMMYLDVGEGEIEETKRRRFEESKRRGDGVLDAWRGTGIAGVAVAGSVFYAFPPVVAASSVFLNSASKNVALIGCCITLLDDVATATISAGTAAAYINDSVSSLPLATAGLTCLIIVGVGVLGLLGAKDGAGITTCALIFHLACMSTLVIASTVQWARHGNGILAANWAAGQPGSARGVARAIFDGACIGFLGVTGFETTPDYISSLRSNKSYTTILRNLQAIAVLLNAPLMLVTFAVLPLSTILDNGTVLSSVAQTTAGKALRIVVTVDACLILSCGVLTGIISASALFMRLTDDRILPNLFRYRLPITYAPYVSLIFFTVLSLVVWGVCGANLAIVSAMFAVCFLVVMAFFPISYIYISYCRPHLLQHSRSLLLLSTTTLSISLVLIIGNGVLSPASLGYFIIYAAALLAGLFVMSHRSRLLRIVWWFSQQAAWSRGHGPKVVQAMKYAKGGPVIMMIKRDDIDRLMEMVLYVRDNEETSNVKLVHFYRKIEDIPSEMEANFKILDEAFPQLTVDLIFVQGEFTASHIETTANRLGVPLSLCFLGCPSHGDLLSHLEVRIVGS